MDVMLIWILAGIGILLVLLPALLGLMISPFQQATRVELIKAPLDQVWATLSELSRQTEWRKDLKSVQLKDDDDGMRWVEVSRNGRSTTLRKMKEVPQRELVVQMERGAHVIGSRQAVLNGVPGGTRVTFTESAQLRSPFTRLAAQMGSRLDKRLNLYIDQVKGRFS